MAIDFNKWQFRLENEDREIGIYCEHLHGTNQYDGPIESELLPRTIVDKELYIHCCTQCAKTPNVSQIVSDHIASTIEQLSRLSKDAIH